MADKKNPRPTSGTTAGKGGGSAQPPRPAAAAAADDPSGRAARRAQEEKLVRAVRNRAQAYLRLPNVTSVGVGRRLRDGKPTDELAVQFTVATKLAPEALAAEGLTPLPTTIEFEGEQFPVDVVQRSYKASYEVLPDPAARAAAAAPPPSPEELRERRRSRLDPIVPGASISHIDGSAGTFGAVVFDRRTGEPYVLSNWHVLHGPTGRLGDAVVQPGPFDDSNVSDNLCGQLVRSHLGLAGDCAVASIAGRAFGQEILELGTVPRRAARAEIDDRVVKSGRTTGVTRGVVTRVSVVANIDYGGEVGVQQVGGFEIAPDPADPDPRPDGEISMGGDSGSAWMIDGGAQGGGGGADEDGADEDGESPGDIIVGLHFAGETDPAPEAEHALACNIHSVLEKLDVSLADPVVEGLGEAGEPAVLRQLVDQVGLLAERMAALEQRPCDCGGGVHGTGAGPRTDGAAAAEFGLPVYGNWCGPGHGGGTPVDDVDRACMTHDNCYGARGYFDCGCDRQLVQDLDRALSSGRVQWRGRILGPVIREWFRRQPCRDHAELLGGGGASPRRGTGPGPVPGYAPAGRRGAPLAGRRVPGPRAGVRPPPPLAGVMPGTSPGGSAHAPVQTPRAAPER